MKVLWFTNIMLPEYAKALGIEGYNIGGWMTGLVNAIREFAPEINLTVVCQGDARPLEINGVRYRTVIPRRGPIYAPKNLAAFVSAMKACISQESPDLIHFHGTEYCFQNYYAETGLSCPSCTSIQGIIAGCLPHYMGGLLPCQLRPYDRWYDKVLRKKTIAEKAEEFSKTAAFEQQIYRRGGNFMGRTSWDKAWVTAMNSASRYFHVGEILRDAFYRPHARVAEKVVRHTVYCGAALGSMFKGGHHLLHAVALLKNRYPDIRLYVANAQKFMRHGFRHKLGADSYERYVHGVMDELGIANNVELLPSLNESQVVERLLASQLFVLPSCIENSPNSLGEAMMLGVPSVSTDVGGVSSMLDNDSGLLVQPCDSIRLFEAIDWAFANAESAKARAEIAQGNARARFDRRTVVMDLTTAYSSFMRG